MQVVQAAQTAILDIAPWLAPQEIQDSLLELDKLMSYPEHEIRSAVTQLYAHLGPALQSLEGSEAIIYGTLLPRILDQAEDMDFQVRRVRAEHWAGALTDPPELADCTVSKITSACPLSPTESAVL